MSFLLEVHVKPGSKFSRIEKESPEVWVVRVKERAIEGKANQAVISLLSEELGIPRSKMKIIRGENFKIKIIEVDG